MALAAGLAERKPAAAGTYEFDRKAVAIERSVPAVKRIDPDAVVLRHGVIAPIATVSNNASTGFIKSLGDDRGGRFRR